MNEKFEFLLNKLADEGLISAEKSELQTFLLDDSNRAARDAFLKVHESLRNLQPEETSFDFEKTLLSRIGIRKKPSASAGKIVMMIIALFLFGIFAVTFYFTENSGMSSPNFSIPFINNINFEELFAGISYPKFLFESSYSLLFGGGLTVILLIATVFIFQGHREFRSRIKS